MREDSRRGDGVQAGASVGAVGGGGEEVRGEANECMEIINLEEDFDRRVHDGHTSSADAARPSFAGQSASDGDTELDGVQGAILMIKEVYLQAVPRVVARRSFGGDPNKRS